MPVHATLCRSARAGFLRDASVEVLSPRTLRGRLNLHGLHARPARNTALVTLAADLPAPVLADLFGLHINTAVRWARAAGPDRASYVASRATPAPAGPDRCGPQAKIGE